MAFPTGARLQMAEVKDEEVYVVVLPKTVPVDDIPNRAAYLDSIQAAAADFPVNAIFRWETEDEKVEREAGKLDHEVEALDRVVEAIAIAMDEIALEPIRR